MLNFTNRRAFVCGSSQGIGFACAKLLAERGAELVLFARSEDRLTAACESLPNAHGQSHSFLVADFDDPHEISSALASAGKQIRGIDILVNNSGGPPGGPLLEASMDAFEKAMRRHLIAAQILAMQFVPAMRSNGSGRIVNIISTSVKQPLRGLGVSNTVRGAVANWAKTLANEEGPHGITVNNVLPGATSTSRLDNLIMARAGKTGRSREEIEAEMKSHIPLGRFARTDEIAAAVAFLCSDEAAYITGINLPVDGGRTGSL